MIAALILLFWSGKEGRKLDERLTFRKGDKIPYGTFVAYENLQYLFPRAAVSANRWQPGSWDSLTIYEANQAMIIVCPEFSADEDEMETLINFARKGNDVFISAMDLAYDASHVFKCKVSNIESLISFFSNRSASDTLTVSLLGTQKASYSYPGKRLDSYFSNIDSGITTVLGTDRSNRPDFVRFKTGKGNIYVHLAPMTFSNYFLLHGNNFRYYERLLSFIPSTATRVVWDEYYLYKDRTREGGRKKKNWLAALLNTENESGQRSFAAAFWILLGLLLIYVLLEMRRKQRYIPVIKKPSNDSLDFVKTVGRLYYDKGDHANLCRKMASYFLEHVRNRYKLPTTQLNDEFSKALHYKTGIDEIEIKKIVSFIKWLETTSGVSDKDLVTFQRQLEAFYKKE